MHGETGNESGGSGIPENAGSYDGVSRTKDGATSTDVEVNNSSISSLKVVILCIFLFLVCPFIVYCIYTYMNRPCSDACDMKKAENRDFNKFYGIDNFRNHFRIAAADACDSDIIFRSVLPQPV